MSTTYLQGEIGVLADFLFKRNTANSIVNIDIDGIENERDLFRFCVDLLTQGILLSSDDDVDIDAIDLETFKSICSKMLLGGIQVNLEYYERGSSNDNSLEGLPFPGRYHIMDQYNNTTTKAQIIAQLKRSTLSHHHLVICTDKAIYDITFEMVYTLQQVKRSQCIR